MSTDIPEFGSIPSDHFAGGSHVAGEVDEPTLAQILNSSGVSSQLGAIRVALDSTDVHRVPWAGPDVQLTEIRSALSGALATGDATVTASIDGTAVTGGVLTVTQAGSAAGDIDSAKPTALNLLADGSVLELTVGGTNTATEFADLVLVFRARS
jgi:hypothetical protein